LAGRRNKSLAIVIRQYLPAIGGAQSQVKRISKGLSQRGWRICIFTQKLEPRHPDWEMTEGAEVVRISAPDVRFFGSIVFLFRLVWRLIARKREIDVVLGVMLKQASAAAVLASKIIGRKVVLRPACSGHYGDVQTARRLPFGWLQLLICKMADAFIAVSRDVSEELIQAGFARRKIHLIPNGVELESAARADKEALKKELGIPEGITILFVGRLSEQKGVRCLVEAFARIGERRSVSLVLIGAGPDTAKLKNIVRDRGLDERVFFPGPKKDAGSYLRAADIFVMPSLSEGMSVALLEAMAEGLPVCASDIPGNRNVIQHGVSGLLFKRGDAGELAASLETLIKDATLRKSFGSQARSRVAKDYSLEKMIESYHNMLLHLAKNGFF